MSYKVRKYDYEEIYRYIVAYKRDFDGVAPTFREIMVACKISSISHVQYILNRLHDDGRIRFDPFKMRGIEVVGGRWVPPGD